MPKNAYAIAAHVKQRHGNEIRVPVLEWEWRGQVHDVIDQRALAQQDAFRTSGGARAIDHQGGVVVIRVRVGRNGCGCGEPGFVLVAVARAAHHDDALQTRDLRPYLFDSRRQFGAHEQQPRAAVVEYVDEFFPDHPPIGDGRHRADRYRADQRFQAARMVLVQERHTLATLHTGGSQCTGGLANPRRPLRPRPLPVTVVNRDSIGLVLDVILDESDECRAGCGFLHGLVRHAFDAKDARISPAGASVACRYPVPAHRLIRSGSPAAAAALRTGLVK